MATPWGLLEYCRMPFGLENAPNTFQRFIDIVLYGLKNIYVYIDDVIIFSEDVEQHIKHVQAVFEKLNQYGLIINQQKSHFFQESIEYLGLEFSSKGYRAVQQCELKLKDMPKPRNIKEVQKFLGMVNYYRTHIPNLASLAAPLYDLCQKHKKFVWDVEHDNSFYAILDLYQKRLTLSPLKPRGCLEVYTDASDVACGAVLLQDKKPIEFYSKKFSPAEQRYSCHERETFAVVCALLHFKHILIGEEFVVFTDHKPLVYWLLRPPVNERHARWLVRVQGLNFTIRYIEGAYNFIADVLSRPKGLEKVSYQELHNHMKLNAIQLHFLSEELKNDQTDEFIKSCKLSPEVIEMHEGYKYVNQRGNLKLLIPPTFVYQVIKEIHNIGHTGRKRTVKAVAHNYFWPTLRVDVINYIKSCDVCGTQKTKRGMSRAYEKFPVTSRFKTVHIDIVGPLPTSYSGKQYLLTMIDLFAICIYYYY